MASHYNSHKMKNTALIFARLLFAIKFQANIHFQTKTKKESNNNNVLIIAIIKQKTNLIIKLCVGIK